MLTSFLRNRIALVFVTSRQSAPFTLPLLISLSDRRYQNPGVMNHGSAKSNHETIWRGTDACRCASYTFLCTSMCRKAKLWLSHVLGAPIRYSCNIPIRFWWTSREILVKFWRNSGLHFTACVREKQTTTAKHEDILWSHPALCGRPVAWSPRLANPAPHRCITPDTLDELVVAPACQDESNKFSNIEFHPLDIYTYIYIYVCLKINLQF